MKTFASEPSGEATFLPPSRSHPSPASRHPPTFLCHSPVPCHHPPSLPLPVSSLHLIPSSLPSDAGRLRCVEIQIYSRFRHRFAKFRRIRFTCFSVRGCRFLPNYQFFRSWFQYNITVQCDTIGCFKPSM